MIDLFRSSVEFTSSQLNCYLCDSFRVGVGCVLMKIGKVISYVMSPQFGLIKDFILINLVSLNACLCQ